ncbi:MAG: DEAD/DEAH box helicase family protein [Planctomycetaceae bacterium]|jgi:superfamily II DNA or RNA helicase|nr:DEAD/DEAH box helicase family protein [Planctomycetaceae bacterium]
MIQLREWQSAALIKALDWFSNTEGDNHFLINAAPGAGKTLASCAIAQELINRGEIERVVVIAPRKEVINQWAADFKQVTGRSILKVTGADEDAADMEMDLCATWSAIQGLQDVFQLICQAYKTLVICDEHHHAAVEAAWGASADSSFAAARFSIVLSGTPVRSDGEEAVWLAYDNQGVIDHPEAGTYTLTYGDAVDLGYCRPVTFHRHDGRFTVDLDDGERVHVSGDQKAAIPDSLKRVPSLQKALDFYRLACQPQFEPDEQTPLETGYQATMLQWGIDKLEELRLRMPEAGGLVIAQSIDMAKYMVDLLERLDGEKPMLVHSQMANPEQKIAAFRGNDKRWLVSVNMVSEGVDIKRLRVLIYLPYAQTELAFRQAIGRVVRTNGYDDDTRAYVVMPMLDTFDIYARRVEDEMPASQRTDSPAPTSKRCPVCAHECERGAKVCPSCEYEFPAGTPRFKSCDHCGGLNPMSAKNCNHCGQAFSAAEFSLTLREALRQGAIVRGMDLEEAEVQDAEAIAATVRSRILSTGDEKLVKIVQTLPEESWMRLKSILDA